VLSSKVDGVCLEGQLGGKLRVAELLTHSYCSAPVGEDPPKFGDLLPSKSRTPAALGGRKEGNTSLMPHALVLVLASSIMSHTHQSGRECYFHFTGSQSSHSYSVAGICRGNQVTETTLQEAGILLC
jgi:hypothetical protein